MLNLYHANKLTLSAMMDRESCVDGCWHPTKGYSLCRRVAYRGDSNLLHNHYEISITVQLLHSSIESVNVCKNLISFDSKMTYCCHFATFVTATQGIDLPAIRPVVATGAGALLAVLYTDLSQSITKMISLLR